MSAAGLLIPAETQAEAVPASYSFNEHAQALNVPDGAPLYCPDFWMPYRDTTNCFTYSLDIPRHGHGVPGELIYDEGSYTYGNSDMTKGFMRAKLCDDGLVHVKASRIGSNPGHIIAGFLNPGVDYHFMRLDRNGLWSHKRSKECPVTNLDDAGRVIRNPRSAKLNGYDTFLGFYRVPDEGIQYCARLG